MSLTSSNIRDAVSRIVAVLPALELELNEADSKLGDGDTGGMLARVIQAIDGVGPQPMAPILASPCPPMQRRLSAPPAPALAR
jgi:hypothetical protein